MAAAIRTLLNQFFRAPLMSSNTAGGNIVGEIREIPIGKRTRTITISNVWIFSVFGLLMCTFMLYFHTVLLENQANRKQQAIIQLRESNDALHAQLAELSTLPVVEKRAQVMGMQSADSYRYIRISSKTVVTASQAQHVEVSSTSYPVQPPLGF